MTYEPTPRRVLLGRVLLGCGALLLGAQLLLVPAAAARDILLYNESHAPIDKVYARPVDPSTQDEMYANFRIDAGAIQPGSSTQLQVTEAFCQFDLLVTFQGTTILAEMTGADLCWHPIVVVYSDGISLQ